VTPPPAGRAADRGEVTVTVVIVPVVLLAVLLVVQFGLAYHARQVLAGAAQDGAAAAARVDSSPSDGAALARTLIDTAAGSLLDDTDVVTATGDGTVTVTATGRVVSLLPFVDGITVRAASSAKLETFDPQGGPP
jgi:Flp pilus assembly protein TadG